MERLTSGTTRHVLHGMTLMGGTTTPILMLCRPVCTVSSPLLSLIVGVSLAAQGPAPLRRSDAALLTTRDATASASARGTSSTSSETRQAMARVLDATTPPAERAETLRALGTHAAVTPDDRALVRDAATRVLDSGITEIRTAAVEALGATGPEAVPALTRAMGDYHYEVRVAAATALGRIGRPALPAAAALAGALDPYLGAAAEAGAALIAIGSEALPIVEAASRRHPPPIARGPCSWP